jgi:hypothetical protein
MEVMACPAAETSSKGVTEMINSLLRYFASVAVAIGALSACSGSPSVASGPSSFPPASVAIHRDVRNECPRSKYAYCVDIYPGGYQALVDWGCTGSGCAPEFTMSSVFRTVPGVIANRRFLVYWDPNPYYSGPNDYTVQNVEERRAIPARNRVAFVDEIEYCPTGGGSCGSFYVGVIPQ